MGLPERGEGEDGDEEHDEEDVPVEKAESTRGSSHESEVDLLKRRLGIRVVHNTTGNLVCRGRRRGRERERERERERDRDRDRDRDRKRKEGGKIWGLSFLKYKLAI